MENQRRLLITILLTLAVMIVYSALFAPKRQPIVPKKQVVVAQKEEAQIAKEEKEPREETVKIIKNTIKTPFIQAVLSNEGAGIKDLYLTRRGIGREEEPFCLLAPHKAGQGALTIEEFNNIPLAEVIYKTEIVSQSRIEYSYSLDNRFKITKYFIFNNSNYSIDLQIKISNLTKNDRVFSYSLIGASQINRESRMDNRFTNSGVSQGGKILWQRLPKIGKSVKVPGNVDWAVLRNSHYSSILRPEQATSYTFIKGIEGSKEKVQSWIVGVKTKETTLSPGASVIHKYTFYAGPTTGSELALLGLEQATNYGKLNVICQALIKALNFFYSISHNYGVAIILLVLIINIFIYPLTLKNVKSMKQMQAVQPHLARLREKHKDDQHKLQTEMMKLYKEHRVNPLGGCLPMLIQMPIFIALYIVLARSAELKGSNFLWIKDLSQPDTLAELPFAIPFLGKTLNLLPIIMTFAMIVQQKVSTGMKGSEDPKSPVHQQQKMMLFMPIIFGVMLYNLPSGLVLYWTINTIFMAAMYYIIQRRFSAEESRKEQQ